MKTTLMANRRRFNLSLSGCRPSFFVVRGKTNRQDKTIKITSAIRHAPCVITNLSALETRGVLFSRYRYNNDTIMMISEYYTYILYVLEKSFITTIVEVFSISVVQQCITYGQRLFSRTV